VFIGHTKVHILEEVAGVEVIDCVEVDAEVVSIGGVGNLSLISQT